MPGVDSHVGRDTSCSVSGTEKRRTGPTQKANVPGRLVQQIRNPVAAFIDPHSVALSSPDVPDVSVPKLFRGQLIKKEQHRRYVGMDPGVGIPVSRIVVPAPNALHGPGSILDFGDVLPAGALGQVIHAVAPVVRRIDSVVEFRDDSIDALPLKEQAAHRRVKRSPIYVFGDVEGKRPSDAVDGYDVVAFPCNRAEITLPDVGIGEISMRSVFIPGGIG